MDRQRSAVSTYDPVQAIFRRPQTRGCETSRLTMPIVVWRKLYKNGENNFIKPARYRTQKDEREDCEAVSNRRKGALATMNGTRLKNETIKRTRGSATGGQKSPKICGMRENRPRGLSWM